MEDFEKKLIREFVEEIRRNPDYLYDPRIDEDALRLFHGDKADDLKDYFKMSNVYRTPRTVAEGADLASGAAQDIRDVFGEALTQTVMDEEPEVGFKNFKQRFFPELKTKMMSQKEFLDITKKLGADPSTIGGLFDPQGNRIYVDPTGNISDLGHELGHAYDFEKNPQAYKRLSDYQDIFDDTKIQKKLSSNDKMDISHRKMKKLSDIPTLTDVVLGDHHLGKEVGRELGFWEKGAVGDYLKNANLKALGALGGAVPFFSMLANEDADVSDIGQAALDTVNPLPSEPIESEEQKSKRKMVEKWLKSRPDSGT